MSRRWILFSLFLAGGTALMVFALEVDLDSLRAMNTYGNFDVPGQRAFVTWLWPGTPDAAGTVVYHFGRGIHLVPIVALGVVFLVFFLLQRFGSLDVKLGVSRWLSCWAAFVVARFGLLRASGAAPVSRCTYGIFPFLNCQACEMATGGCPIGALQHGLQHLRFPLLALSTLVLTGLALGRWICGWLCPFGMVSDLMDRISLKVVRPAKAWNALKFVVLGLVFAVPLAFGLFGVKVLLPFCGTICPSGLVFGLLPFYATTGAADFGAAFGAGHSGELTVILFHTTVAVLYVWLMIRISGRIFCRYVCPLGAFLGLFHRISFVKIVHVGEECKDCGKCERDCPMGIDLADPSFLVQSQCVRCSRCVRFCPSGARRWQIGWTPLPKPEPKLVTEIPVLTDV